MEDTKLIKMAPTELMIGDWVNLVKDYGRTTNQTIKVDPLTLYRVADGMLEVEPIILSSEILKKNDFKYGDGYGYSFVNRKELSGDGFEEEKVYINTALNTLIIYTAASSIHLPVKYIHELQHALRLSGIKKEIEL